jgi:hypothetical protein
MRIRMEKIYCFSHHIQCCIIYKAIILNYSSCLGSENMEKQHFEMDILPDSSEKIHRIELMDVQFLT